jgi:putative transposase
MRYPRIKPEVGEETFMHVYNRVSGPTGEFPFGPAEKEEFIRRLHKLSEFYTIDVIAYQVMGNHWHALIRVPAEPPSCEEAAARYHRYYDGKRSLKPQSRKCAALALKLRDISSFLQDLQQPFARWFNRTRPSRRRGHLWAERFKNTILESGLSVWECWQYIEMNPVRAGMAETPADYRFCSFGAWSATGRHPFEAAVLSAAFPRLKGLLQVESLQELQVELRKEFARHTAVERRLDPEQIDTAIAVAAEKEKFALRLDRRVRYWVDGLVIGSELFVRNVVSRARPAINLQKRRFTRAIAPKPDQPQICCLKQLRVLLE